MRDAAGNFAAAASIAQATDGARPVLLSAATADVDDDGRLDRVTTGWSEPLDHPDDSATPFPVSVEQLAVARVRAAAGQTLDIDLTEPAAPDTGSAPDLTYAGGADPIRDVSGLEPAQMAYCGPHPRRAAAAPRVDRDGGCRRRRQARRDRHRVERAGDRARPAPRRTRSTGRTLGANVSFGGVDHTHSVRRGPGAVRHRRHAERVLRRRPGRPARRRRGPRRHDRGRAAVATETPLDKAAPILVSAKTADLSTPSAGNVPNGTIDAVLTTFSEPIAHSAGRVRPVLAERGGAQRGGRRGRQRRQATGRSTCASARPPRPDGGLTPNVSVQSVGPAADRVKDRAAHAQRGARDDLHGHDRRGQPGADVRAARRARPGGGCTKNAVSGIDGEIDCVLDHLVRGRPARRRRERAVLASPRAAGRSTPAGIGQLGPSTTLEIPLTAAAAQGPRPPRHDGRLRRQRRRRPSSTPPPSPNEALDGTKTADAACKDTGLEPNDAATRGNPRALTRRRRRSSASARSTTTGTRSRPTRPGYLELRHAPRRPASTWTSTCTTRAAALVAPSEVVETGGRRRDRPAQVHARSSPTPSTGSA